MIEHYNHFLPRWTKVSAVTLGRHVFYVMDSSRVTSRLRKHEYVHVLQYQSNGLIKFLYLYFKEYLHYRFKGYKHYDAYYQISFEVEARKQETLNESIV